MGVAGRIAVRIEAPRNFDELGVARESDRSIERDLYMNGESRRWRNVLEGLCVQLRVAVRSSIEVESHEFREVVCMAGG